MENKVTDVKWWVEWTMNKNRPGNKFLSVRAFFFQMWLSGGDTHDAKEKANYLILFVMMMTMIEG